MKGKTHDLNHDLTFPAHTINCVCHSIRSMFRVLGIDNFGPNPKRAREQRNGVMILFKIALFITNNYGNRNIN